MKHYFILIWVVILVFVASACSRPAFPVGTWICKKEYLLTTRTAVIRLDRDHTGVIGIQTDSLLGNEQTGRKIHWTFDKKILAFTIDGSDGQSTQAFLLKLISQEGTSVTWQNVGLNGVTETWNRVK